MGALGLRPNESEGLSTPIDRIETSANRNLSAKQPLSPEAYQVALNGRRSASKVSSLYVLVLHLKILPSDEGSIPKSETEP